MAALEELCAAGVTLNVTLIFSMRQYEAARDAVWRGAQRRKSLEHFKSVYSIFVSRVDVYTEKHVPELSAAAQGQVGIVNAKRIWQENQKFWADKGTPLKQEMIFASTGTKKPEDPPGSMSRRSPAAISRPIRRPPTKPSRRADGHFAAWSTSCRRPRCWPRSTPKVDQQKLEERADEGRSREVRRPAKSCSS